MKAKPISKAFLWLMAAVMVLLLAPAVSGASLRLSVYSNTTGSTMYYSVDDTDAISVLKQKIFDAYQIPAANQLLMFNETMLDDDTKTFADYGVTAADKLSLYIVADEGGTEYGSFVLSAENETGVLSGVEYADKVVKITEGGNYSVSMRNGVTKSTFDRISVTAQDPVNLVLNGISIQLATVNGSAFSIATGADVTLELDGETVLKSHAGGPGLLVSDDAFLTIMDENGTDGSLSAYSAQVVDCKHDQSGTFAEYNGGFAGIGGPNSDTPKEYTGHITIKSGTVNAYGYGFGAGIGGGDFSSGGFLTIDGGTVLAMSAGNPPSGWADSTSSQASGIGGSQGQASGTIRINGGVVEAYGGYGCAGIGGGIVDVEITGDAVVTASGGKYAAGIGGYDKDKGTIHIVIGENTTVTAYGGENASAIGEGKATVADLDLSIAKGAVVKAYSKGSQCKPAIAPTANQSATPAEFISVLVPDFYAPPGGLSVTLTDKDSNETQILLPESCSAAAVTGYAPGEYTVSVNALGMKALLIPDDYSKLTLTAGDVVNSATLVLVDDTDHSAGLILYQNSDDPEDPHTTPIPATLFTDVGGGTALWIPNMEPNYYPSVPNQLRLTDVTIEAQGTAGILLPNQPVINVQGTYYRYGLTGIEIVGENHVSGTTGILAASGGRLWMQGSGSLDVTGTDGGIVILGGENITKGIVELSLDGKLTATGTNAYGIVTGGDDNLIYVYNVDVTIVGKPGDATVQTLSLEPKDGFYMTVKAGETAENAQYKAVGYLTEETIYSANDAYVRVLTHEGEPSGDIELSLEYHYGSNTLTEVLTKTYGDTVTLDELKRKPANYEFPEGIFPLVLTFEHPDIVFDLEAEPATARYSIELKHDSSAVWPIVVDTYTVKFETNGGNRIEDQSVTRGETANKPSDPVRDGYRFTGWYTDSDLTKGYVFSTSVTKDLTLYAGWEPVQDTEEPDDEWNNPFTDVKTSDWFYGDVEFVQRNGYMKGISDTVFAPNETLTRAMLVTILYRIDGEPEVQDVDSFTDVAQDKWYADAIAWAERNGIVKGVGEGMFAPDEPVLREQIAAIFFRYAVYKGYADEHETAYDLTVFEDSTDISDYAVSSLQWAVANGIMNGKSANVLAPKDFATRAEAAAMLQRLLALHS